MVVFIILSGRNGRLRPEVCIRLGSGVFVSVRVPFPMEGSSLQNVSGIEVKRKDLSICHHLTTTIQCLKCQVSHPVVLVFSCQPGWTVRGVHNPTLLSSQHSENMRKSILAESGVKLVAGVFCFKFIVVKAPDWIKFNRIMYGKFTLLWWKRHSWLERVI